MKNLTRRSGRILGLAAITAFAAFGQAQQPISVTINGQAVQFEGVKPHAMDGQIIVPMRRIIEIMGGYVQWSSQEKSVIAQKGSTAVEVNIPESMATVNGNEAPVEGPVHIRRGTTMVPIRFLADSIGATVEWNEDTNTVNLLTTDSPGLKTYPSTNEITPVPETAVPDLPPVISIQPVGTVIQVRLDDELSSETSRVGEPFTATIDTNGGGDYFGLPDGTKVKGHVAFVQPMRDGIPGVIGLSYDGLILNDGRRLSIWATPIGLDTDVTKGDDGRWMVSSSGETKDDMKFVGSGSANGVLVPLVTTGTTVSSDVIDIAVPGNGQAYDVMLSPGTALGVRIDRQATIRAPQ